MNTLFTFLTLIHRSYLAPLPLYLWNTSVYKFLLLQSESHLYNLHKKPFERRIIVKSSPRSPGNKPVNDSKPSRNDNVPPSRFYVSSGRKKRNPTNNQFSPRWGTSSPRLLPLRFSPINHAISAALEEEALEESTRNSRGKSAASSPRGGEKNVSRRNSLTEVCSRRECIRFSLLQPLAVAFHAFIFHSLEERGRGGWLIDNPAATWWIAPRTRSRDPRTDRRPIRNLLPPLVPLGRSRGGDKCEKSGGRKSTVGHVQIDSLCSHLSASLSVEIWGWANGYDEWLATTRAESRRSSGKRRRIACEIRASPSSRFVSFRLVRSISCGSIRTLGTRTFSYRFARHRLIVRNVMYAHVLSGGNVEGLTGFG